MTTNSTLNLLTEREYAEQIKRSLRTAQREREDGTGCPYVKLGKAIRYRLQDIDAHIAANIHKNDYDEPGGIVTGKELDSATSLLGSRRRCT